MKIHKAKKSLGQNFLKSALALKKITEAGEIKKGDLILEIGPGIGALTEILLGAGGKVLSVEKDRELIEILKEKFAEQINERTLLLVHENILDFEMSNYSSKNYKVIANIPYNITGAILKKFLSAKNQPEKMVLMVQREVAKRIMGRDSESILSISVKAYGEPEMIMKVPARYFSPAPKVDSAVILIKNISRIFFEKNNLKEDKFFEILRAGFAHKRKKLGNNLKSYLGLINKGDLGNTRAEELDLKDWIALAKMI